MFFHDTRDFLELLNAGISHAFIQKALRAGNNGTFSPEAIQRDANFFRIATLVQTPSALSFVEAEMAKTYRNTVRQDIHFMAFSQEIQGGLSHANMRLDSHNHNLSLLRPELLESLLDFRDPPTTYQNTFCPPEDLHRSTTYMLKALLSAWAFVLIPSGLSRPNSGHVSPNFPRNWVVAKTGISRTWLALSNFCVVATTFENSKIAPRNFSCKSQMLATGR